MYRASSTHAPYDSRGFSLAIDPCMLLTSNQTTTTSAPRPPTCNAMTGCFRSKLVSWLLVAFSGALGINTLLVFLKQFQVYRPGIKKYDLFHVNPYVSSVQDCNSYCNCTVYQYYGIKVLHLQYPKFNYTRIAASVPQLDLSYRTQTLTRLGSDLNFYPASNCPSHSAMLSPNTNFTPLHLNCPTLFLVGARKGGTTSLYHYISKHPDFEGTRLDQGPKVGETFYFSSYYKVKSWERYLRLFPSGGLMTGEASVGNLVHCEVPKRLFDSCGKQAKVVMLFRNPTDRFVSNFLMRAKLNIARIQNTTSISTVLKLHLDTFFHKALKRHVDVTNFAKEWGKLRCLFDPAMNMVFEGAYYIHLLNWLCNFPPENILIINSEEFYKKPSIILDQVIQFLGLRRLDSETYDWITAYIYNKGSKNVPTQQRLTEMDKKKLVGLYKQFNAALLELLDWKEVQSQWNK